MSAAAGVAGDCVIGNPGRCDVDFDLAPAAGYSATPPEQA